LLLVEVTPNLGGGGFTIGEQSMVISRVPRFLETDPIQQTDSPICRPTKRSSSKEQSPISCYNRPAETAKLQKEVTMTYKLTPAHLQRCAIVYVRQSTPLS
jgi:hypothetical protein